MLFGAGAAGWTCGSWCHRSVVMKWFWLTAPLYWRLWRRTCANTGKRLWCYTFLLINCLSDKNVIFIYFYLLNLWFSLSATSFSGSVLTVRTRYWERITSWWGTWTAVKRKATVRLCTRVCAAAHTSATSTSAARPTSSLTYWAEQSQNSRGVMSKSVWSLFDVV